MMEYCKYHPLTAATHKCNSCHSLNCDACGNANSYKGVSSCYFCQQELVSLGDTNDIVPFWRRLEESFRYPMNSDSIMLIVGISILTAISMYLPFAIIWYLILTGALFKYCFSCLENTSNGNLTAPDMGEAYGGGFGLIFKIIFMVVAVSFVIGSVFAYLGPMLASVVGIVLIAGFPAMMINLALTEELVEALNPAKMIKLMTAIGLPYGLLLAFVMIMSASVSIINQLIGAELSIISTILQSAVGNYYMIVIFHIMGYMIFQYQKEIGFETNVNNFHDEDKKSVLQKNIERIDVLIKEGEYDAVIKLYLEVIENYPDEKNIKRNYFELLLASKNIEQLDKFAADYFDYLLLSGRKDQIPITFKRVLKVNPNFIPHTAEQRLKLAKICNHNGDSITVIKLINGMHKTFPDYSGLIEAYGLMADALDSLPNMQEKAKTCKMFIKKLVSESLNSV